MSNEQKIVEVKLIIDDIEINNKISNMADVMGISPDEVASRIIREYADRYCLGAVCNE